MKIIQDSTLLYHYLEKQELHHLFGRNDLKLLDLFELQQGEKLCEVGDEFNTLYFLVKGKIKVYTTRSNGKSLLIRFYSPLSIIGEVEYVTKKPARNAVETVTDCIFISISYENLNRHYYERPDFLHFILAHMSKRLHTSSNTSSINLLTNVENRLASYLLSTYCVEREHADEIKTSKLTETADMLGTSYRHLNRVIKELCARDIIEKKSGRILIKDQAALEEIADGNIYE